MLSRIRNRWHPLWRLRKSPLWRRFQGRFDFTVFTRIPETGIKVAVRFFRDATWIAAPAALEPEVRKAFLLLLGVFKPAVFWDIGSNIGFYSWLLLRHPSTRQVLMFEPDPVNFALISRTIHKNTVTNCTPLNVALSDQVGESTFLADTASGAAGCLEAVSHRDKEYSLHHAYAMSSTIPCRTTTVDALVRGGMPAPDLIKIDIEGAEHLVLAGAVDCLARQRPVLVIETFDAAIIRQMSASGYVTFRIDGSNFLCVPHELRDGLSSVERVFPLHAGIG